MKLRSLTVRLVTTLVSTQTAAIMLAMLIFPLVAPYVTFDDIADTTLRARLESSLHSEPSRGLHLMPDRALKAYLARRPNVAFAIMRLDDRSIVAGSDPVLAARLTQLGDLAPRPAGNLITVLPGHAGSVIITTEQTRLGKLVFATVGNVFSAEDWPSLFIAFLPAFLPLYAPVILGALVLMPLIVLTVTRPLRTLSAQAALVTPEAPEIRLVETGLGSELQTLAQAVNAALRRIEEGVARQRLYAANAAHELRTPIAILSLHLADLEEGAQKARLEGDLARIRMLTEQLVTVARLGQNHVAMDERISLTALLRDVVADRAPLAFRGGREIALEAADSEQFVTGNRQALFSALANVVDNAIRAEPTGGTVLLRLSGGGLLEVCDHGRGIPAEFRTLVLEPFWRGEVNEEGSGLGLAIVKEIADRHGIALEISDTPGGGATFRFAFPVTDGSATAARQVQVM